MKLKTIKKLYLGSSRIKKIYQGKELVYSWVSLPPAVAEDNVKNTATANDYNEGSTSWGDLTLSAGATISEDGLEFQNEQTYLSTSISAISYPMTFEWKGRIDNDSYKLQANHPGMIFGIGPTRDSWGDSITCYSTTDYGIIIDTQTAMTLTTSKTPNYAHIVITVNSRGILTLYINGIDNKWATTTTNSAITSTKTYIFNGEGTGRFIGAINLIRIWDSLLSNTEISQLFADDDNNYKYI